MYNDSPDSVPEINKRIMMFRTSNARERDIERERERDLTDIMS